MYHITLSAFSAEHVVHFYLQHSAGLRYKVLRNAADDGMDGEEW